MKLIVAFVISVACIVADRLSKTWALSHLQNVVHRPFLPGLVQFTLVTNTGSAFSLARGYNELLIWVVGIIIASIILWFFIRQQSSRPLSFIELCGVGFLIGGAAGNLWDRIIFSHVIDFLDFVFINFPVFNLSDVSVDIGIGLIIIGSLRRK